jgi:hypothetical protein
MKTAVIAEENVLSNYQCVVNHEPRKLKFQSSDNVVSTQMDSLCHPSGWKFTSFHRHILAEGERSEFCKYIKREVFQLFESMRTEEVKEGDELFLNSYHLHLPPVLYGVDILNLQYSNSAILTIDPADSILCWINQVWS